MYNYKVSLNIKRKSMTQIGKKLKTQVIIASIIGILTFGIYDIIVAIMMLNNIDEFENRNLAIATGICLLPLWFLIPLILVCLLK